MLSIHAYPIIYEWLPITVDATYVRNPRKWVYKYIAHKFPNQKRKRKKTKVVVFKVLYNLKIDIV